MADIAREWREQWFSIRHKAKNVMPTDKRWTKAQNLPKTRQELTPTQAKRVKGGLASNPAQLSVAMGDGSVRVTDIKGGTSNTLLPAIQKK